MVDTHTIGDGPSSKDAAVVIITVHLLGGKSPSRFACQYDADMRPKKIKT